MDELEMARAIRDGTLPSPQKFGNVWLFDLRITGTGAAFRLGRDEHVWRDPTLYLNDEFLARCNGLSVIWQHPPGDTLNSDEFAARVIGSIFLPFIRGDEVHGIAKIYDADAAANMKENQLSTSPAVVFRASDISDQTAMPDGSKFVIEGKPALLDHLAVVPRGVWDKGQQPSGVVRSSDEGKIMTEDEKKAAEEKARKDSEGAMGEKLDMMLKGIDSLTKRMDSYDNERKADKSRLDTEEEAKKKADAEADEKRAAEQKEREELAEAQSRADGVANHLGERAPPPMSGENPIMYRRRLARIYQAHSKEFGKVDLRTVPEGGAFDAIETKIYADAVAASASPIVMGDELREVVRQDASGRRISTFYGEPRAWMKDFMAQPRRLVGIRNRSE